MKTFRLIAFLVFISLAGATSAAGTYYPWHPHHCRVWIAPPPVVYYGPRVYIAPPPPVVYYGPPRGYYHHHHCGGYYRRY
jgi:hypothetical protein